MIGNRCLACRMASAHLWRRARAFADGGSLGRAWAPSRRPETARCRPPDAQTRGDKARFRRYGRRFLL